MNYYHVTVTITQDVNGKTKKAREHYLVHAVSVTDAETKVVAKFEGVSLDYSVTAVKDTRIVEVIA